MQRPASICLNDSRKNSDHNSSDQYKRLTAHITQATFVSLFTLGVFMISQSIKPEQAEQFYCDIFESSQVSKGQLSQYCTYYCCLSARFREADERQAAGVVGHQEV